jgi:uncharacterized protein YfaT (DUF1175 family)
MNNLILEYFRAALSGGPGTYFELENGTATMVSILSDEFPDHTFITVNPETTKLESVMSKIVNRSNVLYYASSAEQYNQFLNPKVAETQNVNYIFFDQGLDYNTYSDGLKIMEKYINIHAGYVVFADVESETMKSVIDEFRTLIGYRIIAEHAVAPGAMAYEIREQ